MYWYCQLYYICGIDRSSFELNYDSITGLIHPEEKQDIEKLIRKTIKTGNKIETITRISRPDNSIVSIHLICEMSDKKLITVFHDISALAEAKQALAQVEKEKGLILDSTSEMFIFYDEKLKIRWANKTVRDYLKLDLSELAGRHCYELILKSRNPCECCPVLEVIESKETREKVITTPDKKIWQVKTKIPRWIIFPLEVI